MDERFVKNGQDAEGDIHVAIVVPVPVHGRETAVVTVTRDETVVGTVSLSFRVQICLCPSVSRDAG